MMNDDTKIKIDEVKIAVVLALPRELAGAKIIFADENELQNLGVQFGFSGFICRIPTNTNRSENHAVVLAVPPLTGNNHSAICVAQLVNNFENLEHVILCGIAGGVPTIGDPERDVYLGDIVVANKDGIFQHDFGHDIYPPKIDYLLDKPKHPYIPSEDFDNINNSMISDYDLGKSPWVDRLNQRLPILAGMNQKFSRPTDENTSCIYDKTNNGDIEKIERIPTYKSPKIFSGGIASGNCVLKNPFRRDNLRNEHKILAVEMEAAGLAAACKQMGMNYTVVRGICDYCDSNKNDAWQYYAAATAAAYTYCVVERIPTKPRRTHKVNGEVQTDFSSFQRIAMQSAEPGASSASANTGIELNAVSSDTIINTIEPTQVELDVRQHLHEMKAATAQHDWKKLFNIAELVERTILTNEDNVSKDVCAEGLYQVARAYSTWSQLNTSSDGKNAASRAAQIIKKAQEILG